jgi:hypothetical protein
MGRQEGTAELGARLELYWSRVMYALKARFEGQEPPEASEFEAGDRHRR